MPTSFDRMRQTNRNSVLTMIRQQAPIARYEIADRTGLTRPTVSDIVSELVAQGWVRETGPGSAGAPGRRPQLLEFVPEARLVLGIEVGITRVQVGLFDLTARLLARDEHSLALGHSPAEVVAAIDAGIQRVLAGQDRSRLLGAGVGLHGLVDSDRGICLFAPHFGWRQVPIRDMLAERLVLPVAVDNDVRAMALGESRFGSGQGAGTLVCISVGTGIGAGIVMNGQPYRGLHGGAGEIGHTKVDPQGKACTCGGHGCLETVASGPAVAARAAARLAAGEPSLLAGRQISGETVFAAAQAGDRLALEVLAEAGHYLGIALANLVNLLNPEVVAIGGGVAGAGPFLLDPLAETLQREALPGLTEGLRITPVRHGGDAGMVGAAALILHSKLMEV